MHPAAAAALRWLSALIGLVALVTFAVPQAVRDLRAGIQIGDEAESSASGAGAGGAAGVLTGPVADGEGRPVADFAVTAGAAKETAARILTVLGQPGDRIVIAFDRIPGDPACVGKAQVEVFVLKATPTELRLFPSAAFEPTVVTDDAPVPDQPPLPTPPPLAFTDGTPGFLAWDVTVLYKEYVAAPAVPPAAPFVVAVSPSAPTAATRLSFAASEAGPEDAPRLTWAGVPGCGGPSAASAAPDAAGA
jgi:hypothetical protein